MTKFLRARCFLIGLTVLLSPLAYAKETVYLSPDDFIAEYLPDCQHQALWLRKDIKAEIEKLIDHPFQGMRVRYCQKGSRTAWILDEIGKTEPITSGIIIDQGQVEWVRVLIFRESRGSEVHRSAFTRQYETSSLNNKNRLNRPIDGITGATLSVSALNRQVKLALFLDEVVRLKSHDS